MLAHMSDHPTDQTEMSRRKDKQVYDCDITMTRLKSLELAGNGLIGGP